MIVENLKKISDEFHLPPKGKHFIYFLMKGETVVYVGKSQSLISRWASHQSDKTFNKVRYIEVLDSSEVDSLELAFIKTIKPQYNSVGISGKLSEKQRIILEKYSSFDYKKTLAAHKSEPVDSYGYCAFIEPETNKITYGYYDDEDHENHEIHCPHTILDYIEDDYPWMTEILKIDENFERVDDLCNCKPHAVFYPEGQCRSYMVVPFSSLAKLPEEYHCDEAYYETVFGKTPLREA